MIKQEKRDVLSRMEQLDQLENPMGLNSLLTLMADARAEIRRARAAEHALTDQLETERMKLMACSVAALGGYNEKAHPEYHSDSLDDVLKLRKTFERVRVDSERLEFVCGSNFTTYANRGTAGEWRFHVVQGGGEDLRQDIDRMIRHSREGKPRQIALQQEQDHDDGTFY